MNKDVIKLVPKETVIYEKDGFKTTEFGCGCIKEIFMDEPEYYLKMCEHHEEKASEYIEDAGN